MKKISFLIIGLAIAGTSVAQTKTTNDLEKRFDGSFALYFYNSTLKMLNQTEDKDFDELVKDIEKMKFLIIDKSKGFTTKDYSGLIKGYKSEDYESMMTARSNGKNFDLYIREDNDRVKGTVILVNDSSQLYVLDIVGRVQPNQMTKFFSTLDGNSEIAQQLKSFTSGDDEDRKRKKKEKGIKID
jgi:hypothetical protein